MTIAGMAKEGKTAFGRIPADYLIILIILLTASAAFALGILAGRELGTGGEGEDRLWIEDLGEKAQTLPAAAAAVPVAAPKPAPAAVPIEKNYVASKNGARYYLPECSGVKRIKEENKVWFATKEIAGAEGYTPAANCPGL
ncbi:MAG TPA: hypothetical protein VFY28_02485 [Candidatus Paceibacterota bacterium]|nr:hypothetical protein [Candidatus Paceibacterota bacterium]